MRQKLTACTVLCLLGCILQASAKDRLHFSGSCHFLCTLFSLTFPPDLPATPHAVSEKALHHVHYYATPPSVLIRVLHSSSLSTSRSPWPQRSSSQRLSELFFRTHCSSLHPFTSSICWSLHRVSPVKHAKTPAPFSFLCLCISALMHGCPQAVSHRKPRIRWEWGWGSREPRNNKHSYIDSEVCVAIIPFCSCERNKQCGAVDFYILT